MRDSEEFYWKLIQKKLDEWGYDYDLDDIEIFLRAVKWAQKEIMGE